MQDREITVGCSNYAFTSVHQRSEQLASGLVALGVNEGQVIAVLLHNCVAYLEIILACRRLGVYYCPVNWHFTAPEIHHILEDSETKLIITCSELLETAQKANTGQKPVICLDADRFNTEKTSAHTPKSTRVINYTTWLEEHRPYTGPVVSPRGHMAYTSGTTGKPKGVVRAPVPLERLKDNQTRLAAMVEATLGLTPGCRALLPAPLYHSAPSLFCQMALQMCQHFVVMERFDAENLLAAIEKHRIEVVYLVPIMYTRLLKLERSVRERYDISSLRFVASTGSPCPPDIKKRMIDWMGPIIHETYASSEAGMITLATPTDALKKPGTAGKPFSPAIVRIFDDQGTPCPAGQIGRIYVGNPVYPDFTYKNNPEARRAIEHQGLISLGDMGYLDKEGYLFVCDRESDLVISGGVNIYPAEIEHALMNYPGITDCVVFGIPDSEFGEKLLGIVQTEHPGIVSLPELTKWLETCLARYKIPRQFLFTDNLPRDLNGKISRRKIRQAFTEDTKKTHNDHQET